MRSGGRIAAPVLLLGMLTGCYRKQPNAAPPLAAQAPARPIGQMAELIPPMPSLPPNLNNRPIMLNTSVPPDVPTIAVTTPPRRTRRHVKPAQESAQQEAAKSAPAAAPPVNPEVASSEPSENSPIGQLSTANTDVNTADRQGMNDQINATENALNGIHRSLSSDELKTVAL